MAIFISAYGVASNIILYPNQPLNATLLQDVFYDAWWSIIQQFNREDALGKLFISSKSSSNKTRAFSLRPSALSKDYFILDSISLEIIFKSSLVIGSYSFFQTQGIVTC